MRTILFKTSLPLTILSLATVVVALLAEVWTGHEPVPGEPISTWTAVATTGFIGLLGFGLASLFSYEWTRSTTGDRP